MVTNIPDIEEKGMHWKEIKGYYAKGQRCSNKRRKHKESSWKRKL